MPEEWTHLSQRHPGASEIMHLAPGLELIYILSLSALDYEHLYDKLSTQKHFSDYMSGIPKLQLRVSESYRSPIVLKSAREARTRN